MKAIITEDELKRAAKQVRECMLNALPEPEDCHYIFSPEFERKMKRLIYRQRREAKIRKTCRSIAAILLIILFLGSVWLSFDPKAYSEFTKWIKDVYQNSVVYHFFTNENETTSSKLLPNYTFGWLPEGYKVEVIERTPTSMFLLAEDESNNAVMLNYAFINDQSELFVFGNMLLSEEVKIGDYIGTLYYDPEAEGSNTLVWDNGEIVFYIDSVLSKEELTLIAENIILK